MRPAGWQRLLFHLRPTPALVARTEEWFRRHGALSVFFGRLVPVVRSFISYPAGGGTDGIPPVLRGDQRRLTIWIAAWVALGAVFGRSSTEAVSRWGAWSWYVLALFLLAVTGTAVWRHRRAAGQSARKRRFRLTRLTR